MEDTLICNMLRKYKNIYEITHFGDIRNIRMAISQLLGGKCGIQIRSVSGRSCGFKQWLENQERYYLIIIFLIILTASSLNKNSNS